jgi:Xaa-Pro aminopeptidase
LAVVSTERYTADEIERVRALQRLAYDCAEEVVAGLSPGVTEREAAARLGALLTAHGVEGFFHTPFAWFGDRAGFYGFRSPSWRRPQDNLYFSRQFFPTDRRLEPGMVGILDVAPIRDGLCADIGYSFAHGGNHPALARTMDDLGLIRDLVLAEVRAERTMQEVYRAVDAALAEMGYESAHALYPSRVLGHKIGRIPLAGLGARVLAGFDLRTYVYFGKQILLALPGAGRLPLWNESRLSAARPDPGLWAIEPHVRKDGVGAKWEEILVVGDGDAHWLDDDLPHVRARGGASLAGNATVH